MPPVVPFHRPPPWYRKAQSGEVDRVGLGLVEPGEGNEESFKGKEWQMKKWRVFGERNFFSRFDQKETSFFLFCDVSVY